MARTNSIQQCSRCKAIGLDGASVTHVDLCLQVESALNDKAKMEVRLAEEQKSKADLQAIIENLNSLLANETKRVGELTDKLAQVEPLMSESERLRLWADDAEQEIQHHRSTVYTLQAGLDETAKRLRVATDALTEIAATSTARAKKALEDLV